MRKKLEKNSKKNIIKEFKFGIDKSARTTSTTVNLVLYLGVDGAGVWGRLINSGFLRGFLGVVIICDTHVQDFSINIAFCQLQLNSTPRPLTEASNTYESQS